MSTYLAFLLTVIPTCYMLIFSVSMQTMGIQLDQAKQSRMMATEIIERSGGYTDYAANEIQSKILNTYPHVNVIINDSGLKPYGSIVGINVPATLELMGRTINVELYSEAITQVIE